MRYYLFTPYSVVLRSLRICESQKQSQVSVTVNFGWNVHIQFTHWNRRDADLWELKTYLGEGSTILLFDLQFAGFENLGSAASMRHINVNTSHQITYYLLCLALTSWTQTPEERQVRCHALECKDSSTSEPSVILEKHCFKLKQVLQSYKLAAPSSGFVFTAAISEHVRAC